MFGRHQREDEKSIGEKKELDLMNEGSAGYQNLTESSRVHERLPFWVPKTSGLVMIHHPV